MILQRRVTIAIDGPAGAGKSSVAKAVARALNYKLVDTGAIYRAVAWVARQRGVAWDDAPALAALAAELDIAFQFDGELNRVWVDGADATEAIRSQEIARGASLVSALPAVRQALLELQRRLAGEGGAVLEGRDIGTVVCPEAAVKVFLTASAHERARRRHRELVERGSAANLDAVLAEQHERDGRDETREHAPLRAAPDALIVDSTKISFDAVVAAVLHAVERADASYVARQP